jgi:hypothetical protein
MRRISTLPDWLGQPVEVRSNTTERILGLHASVDPDGDKATFSVHFTNNRPVNVDIPLEDMAGVLSELHYASTAMVARQQFKLDRGADKLLEMCESAMRPTAFDVLFDPLTGDRLFIHQFDDHTPIVFRVSANSTERNMAKLAAAFRLALN